MPLSHPEKDGRPDQDLLKPLIKQAFWPAMLQLSREKEIRLYLVGGGVRDLLLGRKITDLDLAVEGDAPALARALADKCGGTFVLLSERDAVARVVFKEVTLDLAGLRKKTIEEDLASRDFTINALAIPLFPSDPSPAGVLDPLGGVTDLNSGIIRLIGQANLLEDPLRLLRAFRLGATLNFRIASETLVLIRQHKGEIHRSAPERIREEWEKLLMMPQSFPWVEKMSQSGVLFELFPELADLKRIPQPGYHHLDALGHSLLTFKELEQLMEATTTGVLEPYPKIGVYLEDPEAALALKWAALFHDLGKARTFAEKGEDKVSFYGHEKAGVELISGMARRLRLSRAREDRISRLIRCHMRPLHLLLSLQSTRGLTARAKLRVIREAGEDLPGVFCLALADNRAALGPLKPADSEARLSSLMREMFSFLEESVRPVMALPHLATGHDLKEIFKLSPGPIFKKILFGIEEARMAGEIKTREEALDWIKNYIAGKD